MDADGYVSILARTDDIINTAGHRYKSICNDIRRINNNKVLFRLSTGALEEALASLESVAECAVVIESRLPCAVLPIASS